MASRPMLGTISALLVESDIGFARSITAELASHEAGIKHAPSLDAAIDAISSAMFDVIVLDMQPPSWRRSEVFRGLRTRCDAPIIVMAEGAEQAEQALSLDSGADDYVMKPFSPRELLARMRAVIRRDRGYLGSRPRRVQLGFLVIDEGTREASVAGKPLALTTTEFDLLNAFAKRPGRILSREKLLRLVRGRDEKAFERLVDVQISRLRQKLSAHPECATAIRTVRGAGYMFGSPSR